MMVSVGDSSVIFCTERISQDVLGELFEFGFARAARVPRVDVEAGAFPGEKHLDAFRREEFEGDEEFEDVGAEEFFERLERKVGQRLERAVAGEEAVDDYRMKVGMEVDVFVKGVEGASVP